jgi:uncharacterized protein
LRSLIALAVVLAVTIAGLVAIALFLASVGSGSDDSGISRQPLTIVTREGEVARLQVEIADTPEKRTAGLSGRQEVPEDTGMLFILPERGPGFWMKDTLVPLSVAFLARCGEIVDIIDMEPLSLELHNTDEDYNFGLEVRQGWFEANDIQIGDIVSIPRNHRPDGC